MAALCGLASVAVANNADAVRVQLISKTSSDFRIEKLPQLMPNTLSSGQPLFTKKPKAADPWQMLTFKLDLKPRCKDGSDGERVPNFVDELDVHVYILFQGAQRDSLVMVDGTVKYVEIPVKPENATADKATTTINAAVFFSPYDAKKIVDALNKKDGKTSKSDTVANNGDLSHAVAAFAVEVTRHDKDVYDVKGNKDRSIIVKSSIKSGLKDKWWTKKMTKVEGVRARSIAETPYAPYYNLYFPPTKPLYGEAAGSSSGSTGSDTPYTPGDGTSDTTDTTATES